MNVVHIKLRYWDIAVVAPAIVCAWDLKGINPMCETKLLLLLFVSRSLPLYYSHIIMFAL